MKVLVSSQWINTDVQTQYPKSMDFSVLVIGDEDFLAALLEQIRQINSIVVQVAANPNEAIMLLQTQSIGLIACQASQRGALELCYQLKNQTEWSSIYCVLIDDGAWDLATTEMERKIQALQSGADVYLEFDYTESRLTPTLLKQQSALLQAEIQVGLRWVKTCQELRQTNDILSAIALSDPLTELSNRRAFEWELPRQIQNARTRSTPLCLIILDVDYFKAINDTYGHLVGDRVLQMLSVRLQHNLRFYDTPFRYGGEEFVILLSNTEPEEAETIAERLRCLIGDQPFTINETLDLSITFSAGTAYLTLDDDEQGVSLLNRADQNLLKAKNTGRNRVVNSSLPHRDTCNPDPRTQVN